MGCRFPIFGRGGPPRGGEKLRFHPSFVLVFDHLWGLVSRFSAAAVPQQRPRRSRAAVGATGENLLRRFSAVRPLENQARGCFFPTAAAGWSAPRPKIGKRDPRNDHKPTQNSNKSTTFGLRWGDRGGCWGDRGGRKSGNETPQVIKNQHKTRMKAQLLASVGGTAAAENRETRPHK